MFYTDATTVPNKHLPTYVFSKIKQKHTKNYRDINYIIIS